MSNGIDIKTGTTHVLVLWSGTFTYTPRYSLQSRYFLNSLCLLGRWTRIMYRQKTLQITIYNWVWAKNNIIAAWTVQIVSSHRWRKLLQKRIPHQQTTSPKITVFPSIDPQKGCFTQIAQYQYCDISAIVASVLAVKGWWRMLFFADSAGWY